LWSGAVNAIPARDFVPAATARHAHEEHVERMDSNETKRFKTGLVTLLGPPNVGKSTLINALLGEKVAIVTNKPQTTRDRILGIRTDADSQVLFLDTPGIHKATKALNRAMVARAIATLDEVDAVVVMVDAANLARLVEKGRPADPSDEERIVLDHVRAAAKPAILLLNKVDRIATKESLLPVIDRWKDGLPFHAIVPISALTGVGLEAVMTEILALLPAGEPLYDESLYTDRSLRFLVAETVREKLTELLSQELPYAAAVEIESYKEGPRLITIHAVIHVERDGQKAIVIGKGGAMLKQIGMAARPEIEALVEKKVMLKLFVRVEPGWSEQRRTLRRFGYVDGGDQ